MGKRKHHYIPRFYLKQFASNNNSDNYRLINLFNINREIIIRNVSLRDQCYIHKFYGKTDEVENLLSLLERSFSKVIKSICKNKKLPVFNSEAHFMMLLFIGIQMTRTKKKADELNIQTDKVLKAILHRDSRISDSDLEKVRIEITEPALFNLSLSLKLSLCLDDLKFCLLETVKEEFLTSDDPVFLYNKYLEGIKNMGTTGTVNAGLLIFFPLSPNLCLLLYDSKIYKIGKPNHPRIFIGNADLKNINALQFVNAQDNLYFSGSFNLEYFQSIAKKYGKARNEKGPRVREFEDVSNPLRTLVMQYHFVPNLDLELSFMSIRRNARRIHLEDRIYLYRRDVPKFPWEAKNEDEKNIDRRKKIYKFIKEI